MNGKKAVDIAKGKEFLEEIIALRARSANPSATSNVRGHEVTARKPTKCKVLSSFLPAIPTNPITTDAQTLSAERTTGAGTSNKKKALTADRAKDQKLLDDDATVEVVGVAAYSTRSPLMERNRANEEPERKRVAAKSPAVSSKSSTSNVSTTHILPTITGEAWSRMANSSRAEKMKDYLKAKEYFDEIQKLRAAASQSPHANANQVTVVLERKPIATEMHSVSVKTNMPGAVTSRVPQKQSNKDVNKGKAVFDEMQKLRALATASPSSRADSNREKSLRERKLIATKMPSVSVISNAISSPARQAENIIEKLENESSAAKQTHAEAENLLSSSLSDDNRTTATGKAKAREWVAIVCLMILMFGPFLLEGKSTLLQTSALSNQASLVTIPVKFWIKMLASLLYHATMVCIGSFMSYLDLDDMYDFIILLGVIVFVVWYYVRSYRNVDHQLQQDVTTVRQRVLAILSDEPDAAVPKYLIREHIIRSFRADNEAERCRLMQVVWPNVVKDIRANERIAKTKLRSSKDDMLYEHWQWIVVDDA